MTLPKLYRLEAGSLGEQWRYIGHLLAVRTGGNCEACGGRPVAGYREMSIHHRQPRGMGGTSREEIHDLCNLLLVCAGFSRGLAGVLGCHGELESKRLDAVEMGWIVPHPLDPADVPVTLFSGRRVLLDATSPFYLPPPPGVAEWAALDTPA